MYLIMMKKFKTLPLPDRVIKALKTPPPQPPPPALPNTDPIRVPAVVYAPPRMAPRIYLSVTIPISDFLYGAFVGLYLGVRNRYILKDLNLQVNKRIYFTREGLEINGSPMELLRLALNEKEDVCEALGRALAFAVGGGFTHCIMKFLYHTFFHAEGNLIPVIGSYFVLSFGDENFFTNFQTFGHLMYITSAYELVCMLLSKGNSTYFVRHYFLKYIMLPFQHVFQYPFNWVRGIPYHPLN